MFEKAVRSLNSALLQLHLRLTLQLADSQM